MADHWNFLANLLGAPGSAEPPPQEDQKQESKSKVGSSSADEDGPQLNAGKTNHGDESDESVLDAIKKVVPEPTVPGFDTQRAVADSAGEVDADAAENKKLDEAWGELASELGVDPQSAPAPRPQRQAETLPPRRAKGDRPSRPPKNTSGGFGNGLGLDLGPEPEEPEHEQAVAESFDSASRDADLPVEPKHGGRHEQDRGDQEDRPRGREDDRIDELAGRGRGSNLGEDQERPRRRGRRGERQRLSEEDADRVGSEDSRSSSRDDSPRPRRRRRSEGSERQDTSARRRERDEYQTVRDEELDEFDTGLVSARDQEASQDDESDRGRSRRRGRRRRGRGSRGDESRSRDGSGREFSAEMDDDRPPRQERSDFDDDHEDDAEVEFIRRGQRRGRSASDEAYDRGDRGPRRGRNRGEAERQESSDVPRRRRRGRTEAEQDEPKRRSVPTWLETVEILVNANIENHKKSPRGGRGRGGKRR